MKWIIFLLLFPILLSSQEWFVCVENGEYYGPLKYEDDYPCLEGTIYPATVTYEKGADTITLEPFQDLTKSYELINDTVNITWTVDTISLPEFKQRVRNVLRQRVKVFRSNVEREVYLNDDDLNSILLLLIDGTPKDSSQLLTRFYNRVSWVENKKQLFRTGRQALINATTYAQVLNIYNQAMDL